MVKDLLTNFNIGSQTLALIKDIESKKDVSVFDISNGAKPFVLSFLDKKFLYIIESFEQQKKLKNEFESFGKKVEIINSADYDIKSSLYKNNEAEQNILLSLFMIATNKLDCLIISPNVLLKKMPSLEQFKNNILSYIESKEYEFSVVIQNLIKLGYKRVEMVEKKGEFAVRGDIIDIFSVDQELPYRLDFFGDEIDTISSFNTQDYSKVKTFKNVVICPNTLCFIDNQSQLISKIENDYEKQKNKLSVEDSIKANNQLEEVKFKLQNNSFLGIENFILPYLDYNENILSFLTDDYVIVYDDVKQIFDKIDFAYNEFFESLNLLKNSGDAFEEHKNLVIEKNKVFSTNKAQISFQSITTSNRIFKPEKVYTFKSSTVSNFYGKYEMLVEEILYYKEYGYSIFIYSKNDNTSVYLKDYLLSKNLEAKIVQKEQDVEIGKINLISKYVPNGAIFVEDKIVIIGTDELLGKQTELKVSTKKKTDVFTLPKIGDYVVHEKYGIGKCIGIERRKFSNFEKDYIVLEYANNDKLFIPTEQIDLISSYISSSQNQKLSKLGSQDFEKIKQKVKSSVKEMAFSLLKLYAEREQTKGFKYQKDDDMTKQFENDFAFTETADQLEAISQIKNDMETGKLMDRLVCGDVGYGKTEVALRAIFKAVQSGKQVAFLAPTTILSQQHYATCASRMNNYGITVEVINRFKSLKEQKEILKRLTEGKIDVLVGTHRLLSQDVVFKDLGLLVLDEEQRFGVQDKEKIKRLKTNIDVLTLSATPIPRTLHMSLSGIRDISLITTAPEGRLPVQTVVTEYSDTLLKETLMRELNRDGQAIVVFNSIEKIYSLAEKIRLLVGDDYKIGVAHGQMDEKTLENEILRLYNGETQILVSTTLIENGINLPNANTLIVVDADKMGLSQLYQLRGRVGRANRLGYAYFTYNKDKVMTEDVYKRLNALMEFTSLGSGFKIAMRDLEIRGCGNVMGKEQHGHMDKVGYDMYCKLLNQAVLELKGEKQQEEKEVKIDISLNAFIPKDYIDSSDERFRVYNLLIAIKTEEDRQKVLKQICDVYGKNLPIEIENLSKISLLRSLCQKLDIAKVQINSFKTILEFYTKEAVLNEKLTTTLSQSGLEYVLKFDTLPIISFDLLDKATYVKLDEILALLKNIADN